MKLHEEQIGSESIYMGKVFNVKRDAVRLPDGKEAVRELIEHNGGAAILALTADNRVPMVRQYRYGAKRVLLEIPAGKIENGEDPMSCAVRELREECGCAAENVESLGVVIPTGAYSAEVIHLYLASGLSETARSLDEDEFLEVEYVPFKEAVDMAADGRIIDAKTIAALFRTGLKV